VPLYNTAAILCINSLANMDVETHTHTPSYNNTSKMADIY